MRRAVPSVGLCVSAILFFRPRLLAVLATLALSADLARAACDVIPGALNEFPSGLGSANTPFAAPDQLIQIRVRPQVCDAESAGLGAPTGTGCIAPESLRATFVFFDQSLTAAAPTAVVLARSCGSASDPTSASYAASRIRGVAASECRSVDASVLDVVSVPVTGGNECRLNVRLPATPRAGNPPDFTLSGPARILVDRAGGDLPAGLATVACATLAGTGPLACIDELFALNGTCRTDAAAKRDVFSHFVALPRPNVYADMIAADASARPTVRFALDDRGNLLANMDWSGVLAQNGASEVFPPPQLVNFFTLIGSGLNASGTPAVPGVPLQVVEDAAFTSYSPVGIQLPPLFKPSTDSTSSVTLFGSADALGSVVRVQRDTGRCEVGGNPCVSDAACSSGRCDTSSPRASFDLRYCISATGCLPPSGSTTPPPVHASAPGGPGAILAANYTARIDGFVPLENLNVCRNVNDLTCVLLDERLPVRFDDSLTLLPGEQRCALDANPGDGRNPVCLDRNADGDIFDTALTLRSGLTGAKLTLPPTGAPGVAVTSIHEAVPTEGPFAFPVLGRSARDAVYGGSRSSGAGCVATLLAEPDQGGSDDNADGESFDPLLRVYCPDASGNLVQRAIDPAGNTVKLAVVAKPSLLGPGHSLSALQPGLEPLVVSGSKAVFLLDEPGNAFQLRQRADVADLALGGAPANGPSDSPAVDARGGLVCFASAAQNLVAGPDPSPADGDVYCHDFASGETFVVSQSAEPPTTPGALCQSSRIRANGPASAPSIAGSGERARVCYESSATNLFEGDLNRASDVFLFDRCSCDTIPLSRLNDGSQPIGPSGQCELADDGNVAVFVNDGKIFTQHLQGSAPETCGTGPVAADPLRARDLRLLTIGLSGVASAPTITGDGSLVAFQLDDGPNQNVYLSRGPDERECLDVDGVPGCDRARAPHLSADGRLLTYEIDDAGDGSRVVVLDRKTGLVEVVGGTGAPSTDGHGEEPAVAFTSANAEGPDAVVRDRVTLLAKFVDPETGSAGAALTADGRTVAYAKDGGVFRTTPDLSDATADADRSGVAGDAVLAVLDLDSGALQVLGPATQAAVGGATIAFVDASGRVFVRGVSGPLTLGGSPALARAVAASDAAVCILGAATGQVACAPTGSSVLVDFGFQGDGLALDGDTLAVLSGGAAPHSLRIVRTGSQAVVANVPGVRRFRVASNRYVAADQCEPDLGVSLNGDGDLDDCVALIVAPDGTLFDTSDPARGTPRHTIVPCTGDVCDDTDPFKLFPYGENGGLAKLRHLSIEAQEPALFADLNGDGDTLDVVVREFVAGADVTFAPVSVPEGGSGNPLAGSETGPGQSQAGAAIPAQVGFCDADGDGLSDTANACQSDANCIAQGACGGTPCCVDIQPRVLALADGDGDGVFDVYDICPTVFDPSQDPTDGDGDGTPDACDESSRCGDGVAQPDEYCDYADRTIDKTTGRPLGSYCNGPANPGDDCTPLVTIKVSESAVNPTKNGVLPTTVFGSPVLNLAATARLDRPPKMIEPSSLVLEPLAANEACGGPGAPSIDDLTKPATYASRLIDQNGDGFADLSLRFSVPRMGVKRSDTQACLRGTFRAIEGRFFPAGFQTRDKLNVK